MDFSENRHTWDLFSHVDILPIMIYYVYILCIYIYICVICMLNHRKLFISITVYSYYLHKQYIHIGICCMYVNQCMYIYIYMLSQIIFPSHMYYWNSTSDRLGLTSAHLSREVLGFCHGELEGFDGALLWYLCRRSDGAH